MNPSVGSEGQSAWKIYNICTSNQMASSAINDTFGEW